MMNLLEMAQANLRGARLIKKQMPITDYTTRMIADFVERGMRNALLFVFKEEGGTTKKNETVEVLANRLALANTDSDFSSQDFIKVVSSWRDAKNYKDGDVYFKFTIDDVERVGEKVQQYIDSIADVYKIDLSLYKD